MRHVAFLIPGIERVGGAERQMLLLARGLRSRGWRVTILALSGSAGDCGIELDEAGIGFFPLHMRKGVADPRGWLRLNVWLYRQRPDILHAHLPHATWMARWSRWLHPGLALVDTLHSCGTGTAWRRFGYRISDWLAERVTAVSEAVAEAHVAAALVNPDKLAVVPNGVDTESLFPNSDVRAAVRRELEVCGGFLWVAAGRLEPVKDYPTLLTAFASLPTEARLAIAGDGVQADELRQLACRLGIGDRVRFLGFIPDVSRLLQAADAVVLSSRWEGLPLLLLEAGALALPSICSDVSGLSQIVIPGNTGWLAEPGNPESFAGEMRRMMRLPVEERRGMGQWARQLVERNYSLAKVLDSWEEIYAGCARQPHRTA